MNNKIKIFLVLLLVVLLTSAMMKVMFLADSPRLRPNLGSYIIAKIENLIPTQSSIQPASQVAQTVSPKAKQPTGVTVTPKNDNIILTSIVQGVYAEENKDTNTTNIQVQPDQVNWVNNGTVVNGKSCDINVPEGMTIPPEILNQICQ